MAFADYNNLYTNTGVVNRNSGNQQHINDNSTVKRDHNTLQSAYSLYRTDTKTVKAFPITVQAENPLFESFKTSDGTIPDQSDHVYEYINKYKVLDIAMVGAAGGVPALSGSQWGKWRTAGGNYVGIEVDPKVLLFPSEKVFSLGYTNDIGNAWEKLSGGLLSKVQGALEAARTVAALASTANVPVGGKMMSQYSMAPQWNGTKPLSISSTLKFEFNFGQAGIFSGEEEVVRPILALASLWMPLGSATYKKGIVPTGPTYLMHFLGALKNSGANAGAAAMEGLGKMVGAGSFGDGASALVETLTNIEAEMMNAMNTAIEGGLGQSRALAFRMGRFTFGPCIVKGCNWSFDFTQTDEYGFPYKGEITFSDLESIIIPNPRQLSAMFNNEGGNEKNADSFKNTDSAIN